MNWDSIPLRDVLQITKAYVPVLDQALYKYAALRPYPNGLSLKGHKRGADFRGKQQQMIRAGQFVISRTRIQQQHWDIVQPELDQTIVHRNIVCFDIHPDLNINYFAAYLATSLFLKAASKARSKRGRLDIRRFVRIPIPLPPLKDQARIAETWQFAYQALKHTFDMTHSIAAIKAGVAADLFKNTGAETKALGGCVVMGRDVAIDYPLYLTTSGKLLPTQTQVSDDTLGIMPNGELDPHFLQYYLEDQKPKRYNAAANTLLSLETAVKVLQIPLPSLYEQRKIVSLLQQHDDVLQKLKIEQHELRHLTQGMMQQIFNGVLPLPEAISLLRTL